MSNDFYEILQVHPHADQDVIQAAYERLIARYDETRLEGMADELRETARQRRAALEEAYATLSDVQLRAVYDSASVGGSIAGSIGLDLRPSPTLPLDYRPLPPAARQERQRHFNAQPRYELPTAGDASRRTALLVAGLLVLAVVGLSLALSCGFSSLQQPVAQLGLTPAPTAASTTDTGFNRFEVMISEARQATQQNPSDVAAWVTYANALYDSVQIVRENAPDSELYKQRLPRWLEASQAYDQALKLQGDEPNALVLSDRGASLCYYGAGISDQSFVTQGLSDTRTAATAAPAESLILFNYGNCLISADPPQVAEALLQWQRILQITPADSPIAARARELLSQHQP